MNLNDSEKDITILLKQGDENAFKEFYLSFYKAVLYFIRTYVQNANSAEDIAQETFFYLWENREKLDPMKGCRSYVLAIARSKALNHLRGTRYDRTYMDVAGGIQKEQDLNPLLFDSMLDSILNKDLLNRINIEITNLPDKQKEVMILSRKKYYSNKEIAQILQINLKTVEYRIMVALRKIKKNLEKI